MSRDRSLLEDELPPDIGREALLAAVSHTTVLTTPVGNRIPSQIGERVFLVHAHRIYQNLNSGSYQPARPEQIPASAISVDNSEAATGYAYLNIAIGSVVPTLGTCFSIQPANTYRQYGDQTGVGAASTKPLLGLREEAGGTPYVISAACEDVLIAGRTFLPVMPVSNVPVAASDPGV
mgnify:CR=1 FL=1